MKIILFLICYGKMKQFDNLHALHNFFYECDFFPKQTEVITGKVCLIHIAKSWSVC